MDERNMRTERTTADERDYDRDVDIRRTMIMGRDLDYSTGRQHLMAAAPANRVLHWGPIFAGLVTTLTLSLLLGALFVGVGFTPEAGVFGGLTASAVGWGAVIVSLISVFLGAYLTGYVSDIRTKAEGIMNGFMVGVMTIFTPVLLALFGTSALASAAATNLPDTTNQTGAATSAAQNVAGSIDQGVRNALVVAADNAWTVFLGGLAILGIAALAGYLGRKSREGAIKAQVNHEIDHRARV